MKITMQDRHLCWPPYFFRGPAMAPYFFHSRIATEHRFWCKLFSQNTDSKKICLCELWAALCRCRETSYFSAHL